MSPQRLRIVVPRYGAQIVGGSESLVRSLALALRERGWEIEVWTTNAVDETTWAPSTLVVAGIGTSPEETADQDEGVIVRRFAVRFTRPPRAFAQASRVLFRMPPRLRPEALWLRAQGPYAPSLIHALASAEPVPTLFTPYLYYPTLVGIGAAPHPRILMPAAHDERPFQLRSVGRAIAAADGFLFHTPEERDLVNRVHPVAASRPQEVGSIGVLPPPDVEAHAFAAQHSIRGPYIYFGGRNSDGKGLDILLAAFAQTRQQRPELSLVLSGQAGEMATRNGVIPVGRLSERERWEAIAGARAVIVPGALESLSLLALEGWSLARPCLLNGLSPVLAGQAARSGGALTFTDVPTLVGSIARVIDDVELAHSLGQAGKQWVATSYDWDAVESRLTSLIAAATLQTKQP